MLDPYKKFQPNRLTFENHSPFKRGDFGPPFWGVAMQTEAEIVNLWCATSKWTSYTKNKNDKIYMSRK